MGRQVKIVPAVLATTREEWREKIEKVKGRVERVQVDVVDKSFGRPTFKIEKVEGVRVEAHLMVREPVVWLSRCRQAGVELVVGQIERMADQQRFWETAWEMGFKVGLAVDLQTPVERLKPGVVGSLDQVLLLAVKAGRSGQRFDRRVLEKIKKVREWVGEETEVAVDGGVNDKTAAECVRAGADVLVVGSFLWKGEWEERWRRLERAVG